MNRLDLKKYIENNTIRVEASRRSGGIEIDASDYIGLPNCRMTAYQNYLGGGILGSIQSDCNCNVQNKKQLARAIKLADALKRYFHAITNEEAGDYDEWSASSYEDNQNRPTSAY